jgi:molybdopterin converting factor small subunit
MERLKVKSFGLLTDVIGQDSIDFDFVYNTDELRLKLIEAYPRLKQLTFSIAVNKKLISQITALEIGDEIALLPPFSGG